MMNKLFTRNRIRILLDQILRPMGLITYLVLRFCKIRGTDRVPLVPDKLDIEPNNDCNFKCNHCQVTHWDKQRVHLDIDHFHEVVKQFPHLTRVKLQGMGEPLLNKDLLQMLEYGDEHGISMRYISNGSIMTQALAEKLVRMSRLGITFSMDGASKEVFEKIRIGGRFEKVCRNIKTLTDQRGGAKKPLMSINTVVSMDNHETLPDLISLAHELGLTTVGFQLSLTDWGKSDMARFTESMRVDRDAQSLATAIEEAQKRAEALGVELILHQPEPFSATRRCPWPWESAYIASNGDVVPCCVIADSDTVKMGNIFESSFKQIWNSSQYQELRHRIRTMDIPSYCRGCYGMAHEEAAAEATTSISV